MKFEDIKIGQRFKYKCGPAVHTATKLSLATMTVDGYGGKSYGWNSSCHVLEVISSQKGSSMFKSISDDLRGYVTANKDLLYTIVILLLIDQYVFGGAFRERLKGIVESLLKKTEDRVHTTLNSAPVKVE